MIEQLSQVMARLMLLKSLEERQEALMLLEEFYNKLRLPPARLLLRMSDEELLFLISINGQPDLDKAVGLGMLLKEEARLHEDMEQYGESAERFRKALYLFLSAERLGADVPGADCSSLIAETRELLRPYSIPEHTLLMLLDYYTSAGQYALAEDALFELLEQEVSPAGQQAGEHFYRLLQEVSDELLDEGRLPRHELEQGRTDMQRTVERSRPNTPLRRVRLE
jgi:hypothetical protein